MTKIECQDYLIRVLFISPYPLCHLVIKPVSMNWICPEWPTKEGALFRKCTWVEKRTHHYQSPLLLSQQLLQLCMPLFFCCCCLIFLVINVMSSSYRTYTLCFILMLKSPLVPLSSITFVSLYFLYLNHECHVGSTPIEMHLDQINFWDHVCKSALLSYMQLCS